MDDTERTRLQERIAAAIGDDAYNRLVDSLKEVRPNHRLRYWQEALLRRAEVPISTCDEFLDLFNGAKWRRTGRSRDALAAATASFWAPLLREHGFRRYMTRSFGRVRNNCVFQFIGPQLSTYGRRDFAVQYTSMIITRPSESVTSSVFRYLPCGKATQGWWNAKNLERADESMRDVCEKTVRIALPWFESTQTPLGLARELTTSEARANPHRFFELACCYATAGRLAPAIDALQDAIRLYQASYDSMPLRTWALRERALAESLAAAIGDGTHANLLARWRDQTAASLKLDRVRD